MGMDDSIDDTDGAMVEPVTDRSDNSASVTSASDVQLNVRHRNRRRRRGSDPEDIFNP